MSLKMEIYPVTHHITVILLTLAQPLKAALTQAEHYELLPSTKLNLNTISTSFESSGIDCAAKCNGNQLCSAVNLGPSDEGNSERYCGLLQTSRGNNGQLVAMAGWTVFVAEDACSLTECQNGASCTIHSDYSFTCHCPQNYIGDLCQISCYVRHDGTCYELTDPMTWFETRDYCRGNGGRLVEIYDIETNEALRPVCQENANPWTGGFSHPDGFNTWFWTGSNLELAFSSFQAPEPNDHLSSERCIIIWCDHVDAWADQQCAISSPGICEYDIV